MEHITTRDAAEFVRSCDATQIAATVTPQHVLLNRNALLVGGIRPHHYCLPVLKRETHRAALTEHVTSGSSHFFLGTDSAPHRVGDKESACGCAGIFSSPVAMAVYAKVFEERGALVSIAHRKTHRTTHRTICLPCAGHAPFISPPSLPLIHFIP